MKRIGWIFIGFLVGAYSYTPLQAKIRVVTTTPDLAAIVQEIGGDRVEVQSISKGYQDPHYVEAKPSYMRTVNQADLLVYVGLQLEIGWLPLLIQGARNPKILPGAKGNLAASQGIEILEIPKGEVDRTMGDIHPEGNPHYWLDPRNGLKIARTATDRLRNLSPGDAPFFEKNLETFSNSLEEKIRLWEEEMAPYRGMEIACDHKQWEYLANWLGLKIVGLVEDRPGIPPTPKHIVDLINMMQEKKIRMLLNANYYDPAVSQKIEDRTGTRLIVLPTSVGGEVGIEGYTDLFDRILTEFKGGIGE